MIGYLALIGFALTIPAANWLIGNVGTQPYPNGPHLIPLGFGLDAPSGVLMIGLALVLRDAVRERLGVYWSYGAIAIGTLLSALLAPPALVLASGVSFALSELSDALVYERLRKRGLIWAVGASQIAGAFVDSALFLLLAFSSLSHWEGNVVGKLLMMIPAVMFLASRKRAWA